MARVLCEWQLGVLGWIAAAFLSAALLLGLLSAIKALHATGPSGTERRVTDGIPPAIGPLLEAIKGLIEALGKAPAWFALFLAGLFLFWVAGEIYVDACKATSSAIKSATAKTTTTLIEKSTTKGR